MEPALFELSTSEIMIRMVCALLAGCMIGIEREIHNRFAGLRTHALVAFGSAAITIISMIGFGPKADPSRIAAQIVSGIGFLGAGTIMKTGDAVSGLTTSASLWVIAGIGIAFGAGQYFLGVISVIGNMIILLVFYELNNYLLRKHKSKRFTVIASSADTIMNDLEAKLRAHEVLISHYTVSYVNDVYVVRVVVKCGVKPFYRVIEELYDIKEVVRIDYHDLDDISM